MSAKKKKVRDEFRQAVFDRDRYRCRSCGTRASAENAAALFDAHHITDRHEMPNGGYVLENGITLCKNSSVKEPSCHEKAEARVPGFTPDELYQKIGSSREIATQASERIS